VGHSVGDAVGVLDGASVGSTVGRRVGACVHVPHAVSLQPHPLGHVHFTVSPFAEHTPPFVLSQALAWAVVHPPLYVGGMVGASVGDSVGLFVGSVVGTYVGRPVGSPVGTSVGASVGLSVGLFVGESVGTSVCTGSHCEHDVSVHTKPFLQLHTLVAHLSSPQRHIPLLLSHWSHSSAVQPPACVGFVVGLLVVGLLVGSAVGGPVGACVGQQKKDEHRIDEQTKE
jgi:hypothetical protein